MNIRRILVLFIINKFLSFTRFFQLKRKLLKWSKVEIGENTKIVGPIYIGNEVNIKMGDNCWIGRNFNVDGNGEVKIGNNVDVAPHVTINTGGHKIGSEERRAGDGVICKVVIGDGVWIGTNVVIVNNTVISQGVVVAAGSVVTKSVNRNLLVAGVPAVEKKKLS